MKATRLLWRGALTLAVVAPMLAAAACGGGGDSKPAPTVKAPATQPAAAATKPAAAPTSAPTKDAVTPTTASPGVTLKVTLTEFAVTTDKTSLPAGNVTLQIRNGGALGHELIIHRYNGPDREEFKDVGEIGAGETKTVTVNLPASKYELACEVGEGTPDSHYDKGMRTDITAS